MRFSSTHQPSRRRGGRPKSPATIERERVAALKEAEKQAAAMAAFEAAPGGDDPANLPAWDGFEFVDAFHRVYNKAHALYVAESDDAADVRTPHGVYHVYADGVTVYFMNDAPRKIVYFNRSIYLI